MLRSPHSPRTAALGVALVGAVGVLCALLVVQGNPPNMGVCGACFLRDAAGALGILPPPLVEKLGYVRPELVGVVLGAAALALGRRRWQARAGSHAGSRFFLGVWMGVGALVFLGCPFRMLQRLGGGDGNALLGLVGFAGGVLGGVAFERRGYTVGKTAPAPAAAGLGGPSAAALLFVASLLGGVLGPAAAAAAPARAPLAWSLAVGLAVGAILSATGFCAVLAARQLVLRPKWMLLASVALVGGYAATSAAFGTFRAGFAGQPVAHTDGLWNAVSMALVGLCGVLAGGCPVRQLVMAGEGNGDAFVTSMGVLLGGAVAHGLGLASSAAGPTARGQVAVLLGLGAALAHAVGITRAARRAATGPAGAGTG
ncbi:MAG: YedE-related selenium metabolism membrane protein [Planctomycetes bacterium]|nr:YedE-related selenium metabolism membrane protein [Planctomycetota bacterium]